LGRQRDLLQDHLRERRDHPRPENLVVWDRRQRQVTLQEYVVAADPMASEANGLSTRWREREGDVLVSIDARSARPLSGGRWCVEDGERIEDGGRRRQALPLPILDDPRFTPADVELAWKAREHPMDLSSSELADLLAREPSNLQYQTLIQYNL